MSTLATQTEVEAETQRVLAQTLAIAAKPFVSAVSEDEQYERRQQQHLAENGPDRLYDSRLTVYDNRGGLE